MGWAINPLDEEEAQTFTAKVEAPDMRLFFTHMPYLMNLASSQEGIYGFSRESLKAELQRCPKFQIPYIVTHLGSHLGAGMEEGVKRVTKSLNEALAQSGGMVTILQENTTISRHPIGMRFEEIIHILENVERRDLVGVCLDISHAFTGGYEFCTEKVNRLRSSRKGR